jgi:hypothetical protein
MANSLLTPTKIAREALAQLENNMVMAGRVHRDYKHEFVDPKAGGTVTIRKPARFTVTDGATASIQDVVEESVSLSVNQRKHVAWQFSMQDMTLTIEEYSERYIRGACIALANQIDSFLCQVAAQQFWMNAGTPGTTPATFAALGDLAKRLDKNSVPTDSRNTVLDPDANWSLADALKGLNSTKTVEDLIRKGFLAELAASQVYMDQNVYRITCGSRTGTILVNGAVSTGASTIALDGLGGATQTVKAGEKFTIAGVNAVNPISKADLGFLQEFTVLADATGSGSAIAALSIAPTIYGSASGGRQNVSALPADNAAITFKGTASTVYPMNLGFHRNALALVTCPIALPESAAFKARVTHRGLSIRVVKWYDGAEDLEKVRLDVLYGAKAVNPDLGGVLWG